MPVNWTKVFSDYSIHRVQLIQAFLEENEISCIILNKQDSMNHFINSATLIELFVNKDFVVKALHLINNNNFE